jgi:hypothetical protein
MGAVGLPELLLVFVLAAFWIVPLAAAAWALVTLYSDSRVAGRDPAKARHDRAPDAPRAVGMRRTGFRAGSAPFSTTTRARASSCARSSRPVGPARGRRMGLRRLAAVILTV